METPIRVVIADDNADMRRIERMMISRAEGFEIVGEAEDGVQLLTLVEQEKPQLVFLDVEMPGKTGVECARVIQDMNPAIVLIFATAHDEYMGDAFLFDVILSDDYDSVWEEHCKAIVGEENAAEAVEMLKSFISGDVYGDDAVALYGDGSEGFIFDCWYLNDVKSFTMNGDEITINKLDGTSETHKYRCIGTYQIGADETMTWGGETFCPAFDCEVYQATDDAGDFTYFFFRDDTMETTYHIEFRYGSDLAALQQYMKGRYAYWLAAGIDANADAETIDNVIALFCTENLSVEE